ncbi:MAG TPA: hypothetical protein PKE16_00925 [Hyphomicrobium sp.]|nr:hypothetical protein [Hyphomicrobium sp.]
MGRARHRLAPPVPGISAASPRAPVAAAKSLFAASSNVVIDSESAPAPSGVRIDHAGASHRRDRLRVSGQTLLAQHQRPCGGLFRNAVDHFRRQDSRSRGLVRKLVALSLGVVGFVQAARADPTVYQTLDFGTYDTFLTGIRGNNIVGNYIIPGTTDTGGIYYNMTTQTWAPMPEATPNGANYPGAIGSSPYGPNFGNPDGILRVVGSYQTLNSSPYDYSYLYDAAAAPGQTLTNLIYPSSGGAQTLFTIAHSTFGNQVVGNYDTRLATGNAFIYNINTGTYTTNNIPGAVSTTAYGIYGNKIAGGYAMALPGGGLGPEHGYIYNQTTDTYDTYDHPGAIATHFEGITNGDVHPAVMHIDALGHVTWYEIDIPGTVVSSNSAYGDNVIGIYIDGGGIHGYLATIPGIYNPIENTGAVTFGGVAWAQNRGVRDVRRRQRCRILGRRR